MKQPIITRALAIILILVSLTLTACGGDVRGFSTHEVPSELYTQAEIKSAVDCIVREFDRKWKGCTLTEIYYAGDETSLAHIEWAGRVDGDEVIVLLSSFEVDSSGGDGSLNRNSSYTRWMWILARSKGGSWKHVDHGY